MPTQLSDMNITGVHLVGSPAIRQPYLIVKSENGSKSMPEDELSKAKKAAARQQGQTDDDGDDDSLPDNDSDDMKKARGGSGAEDMKKSEVMKAKDAALIKSALELLKSTDSEGAKGAIEALEAELGEKKVEKSNKTNAEVAEVVKSMMPDIVKSIEDPIKKSLDEARKELDEVKKSNALLIGERTERELEEICKSLVGDREKNMEYLRTMKSQLNEDAFKALVEREQESASTVRKSSAFKEIGGSGSGMSSGDSAYQQLTDIANGLVQKSSDGIKFNDAFSKAVAQRPDLWDRYRNETYANGRED